MILRLHECPRAAYVAWNYDSFTRTVFRNDWLEGWRDNKLHTDNYDEPWGKNWRVFELDCVTSDAI